MRPDRRHAWPCAFPHSTITTHGEGGAGTTSLVSMQEGRRSIICELNLEYAEMARQRHDVRIYETLLHPVTEGRRLTKSLKAEASEDSKLY